MEGERVWEEWPPQERKELVWRLLEGLGEVPRREHARNDEDVSPAIQS
jgi:hypothetical protein